MGALSGMWGMTWKGDMRRKKSLEEAMRTSLTVPSVESLTSHFTAPRPAPVPAQTARGLGKQILCVMFSDLP